MPGSLEKLRKLAESDAILEPLAERDREVLAARWLDRAHNEQATSAVFAEVSNALERLSAPQSLVQAARTAVDDEQRHAQIAWLCAEYYAGRALPAPPARRVSTADFAGCSPRESAVLYVVMQCAINESIAAGYLKACAAAARSALTKQANLSILGDEVRHARLGWSFLSWCSAADRSLVGEALPSLFTTVVRGWFDIDGYPQSLSEGHGCLDGPALTAAALSALEELVLPGFEHTGFDTESVQRMLRERGYLGRRNRLPVTVAK
jgi:hypothetical protein